MAANSITADNIANMVNVLNESAAKRSAKYPTKVSEVYSFIANAFADTDHVGTMHLRRMLANKGAGRAIEIVESAARNMIAIDLTADTAITEVMREVYRLHRN